MSKIFIIYLNLSMKLNYKLITVFLSLLTMQALSDGHMHTVSGSVTGCSTKNAVHVLIYEESGWKGMNHSQEKIYEPS